MLLLVGTCLWVGGRPQPFRSSGSPQWSADQVRGLALTTLLLLPLIAYSIYSTRNGIVGQRVGAVYITTDSVGYLNDAQFVLAPLICAWLLITRFHWLNLVTVAAYVAYRTWFGWSRWTILLFFLTLVLAHCWHRRAKWPSAWAVLAAIPVLLLFNLLGHNREVLKDYLQGTSVQRSNYVPGQSRGQRLREELDTLDFGSFDFLAYIVAAVPERTEEYTYGKQYAQLFTEPIPRKLWKGKPVGSPVKLISLNDFGNFIGLTCSLPGDGWLSGGWVGLIITMSLVGAILGWGHRFFWRHSSNNMAALLYVAGLAMVPQWYRDGGISIFKFLLFTWMPCLVWLGAIWWVGPRRTFTSPLRMDAGEKLRMVNCKPVQS
jgi:hypothetical protein